MNRYFAVSTAISAVLAFGLLVHDVAHADPCTAAVQQIRDQAEAGRLAPARVLAEMRNSCPADVRARVQHALDELAEAALDAEAQKQHQMRVGAYSKVRNQLEAALNAYAEFQGLAAGAAMQSASPVVETKFQQHLRMQGSKPGW
jgi:hypothetical protein